MSPVAQARYAVALSALTVGAVHHFPAVIVRRVSLLTYDVGGFLLDLEAAAEEAAFLTEEREAIQDEPSLCRAAEIVERHLRGRHASAGRFVLKCRGIVAGSPVWCATWIGYGGGSRKDREALEDLAAWAVGMGLHAQRSGYEVIAHLPPDHPAIATRRGASNAERAA